MSHGSIVLQKQFMTCALLCVMFSHEGKFLPWTEPDSASSQEIEKLAARTAQRIEEAHPQSIVLAMREGCVLDPQLCTDFEVRLRTELEKALPSLQFTGHDKAVGLLKENGFFSIDGYNARALRLAALATQSELLVTENLLWTTDGYSLTSEVREAAKDISVTEFNAFKVKVPRTTPDSDGKPLLLPDPENGVSTIVFRGKPKPPFRYPACDRCPNPPNLGIPGSVELMGTITVRGTVESISVLKSTDARLTDKGVKMARSWRYKPGIDVNGRPFAARVDIEVTY
jgi:phage baseplate assembly protein gpV